DLSAGDQRHPLAAVPRAQRAPDQLRHVRERHVRHAVVAVALETPEHAAVGRAHLDLDRPRLHRGPGEADEEKEEPCEAPHGSTTILANLCGAHPSFFPGARAGPTAPCRREGPDRLHARRRSTERGRHPSLPVSDAPEVLRERGGSDDTTKTLPSD